jgi:hypothetical protein
MQHPKLASNFHSRSQKSTGNNYSKCNVRRGGGWNLARLASGFIFLLASPEFAFGELASGYPHSVSAHLLLPLSVNSKSERKVSSLPPLGFEPVIFGMLAHLSDHSAKSHSRVCVLSSCYFRYGVVL